MTTDRKAILTHAYAESAKGNGRILGEMLADDVVYIVKGQTPWSGVYRGRAEMVERCIAPVHRKLKRPAKFGADRIVVDGDVVAIEGRGQNETLDGRPYNNSYCWILRFENDRIVEFVEYMDAETAKVLGAPGEGEGPVERAA